MTDTVAQPTTEKSTLPESWEWSTLSEIGMVASGGTPKTKEPANFDGDIPWITPADLSGYTDKTIAQGNRNISQKGLDSSSARLLPEGTVIFSSRAPVGYVVIAEKPVSTNQGCKNLIPSDGVFNEYVYYYLKGSKSLAESYASGTTFLELSSRAFGRLPIPLPPLNEQRRIVQKIEELFTRLDAGIRSLEQTRALLKSYHRSVLKAAVEGELSREWREARRDELEPASELLERILQERREKFAGKKYKEPASPDTSKLPTLPDGWKWASLGQLLMSIEAGKNFKCKEKPPNETELGLVKISSVTWGRFNEEESKTVTDLTKSNPERLISAGDFLFSRANTLELVGACVIVHQIGKRLMLSDKVLRFQFVRDSLKSWALFYLRSYRGRQQIESLATGNQLSMRNISQVSIHRIVVPFPSTKEMEFVVEEIERRLSVVDKLAATVEENLRQADALRQSILKRAFSGELVEQDPADEPASVLLERIREGRQGAKPKARKKIASVRKDATADEWVPELFPRGGA